MPVNDLTKAIREVLQTAAEVPTHSDNRQAFLNYLRVVTQYVRPQAVQLTGSLQDPVSRVGLALYCTLLQLAEAILVLATAGPSIAVPTLMRQALDAYIDLHNLMHHENYWKGLELADDITWMKALQEASAGKNPYLQSFTDSKELPEYRRQHAQRIAEFERQGVKRLEAKERFVLADAEADYTVWSFLSAFAHNNLSLLHSRHFEPFDRVSPALLLSPERVPYEISSIGHVGELLTMATAAVHQRFGKGDLDLSALKHASERLQSLVATRKG